MNNNYIVYLDMVLLINFFMDLGILWATSKLSRFNTTGKRLCCAALLGSIYSLAVFLPEMHWLFCNAVKLLFSMVMVLIAFSFITVRRFFTALAYFYLISFAAAGAMLGAIYFFKASPQAYRAMNGVFVSLDSIEYFWLLAALIVFILVGRYGASYLKKSLFHYALHVPVVIRFGDKLIPVQALLDTGNNLRDPLTQLPVMVVEYSVLKEILPNAIQTVYESGDELDLDKLLSILPDGWWTRRIRLIPFNSLGKKSGLMLAFRPDVVLLKMEEKLVEVKDVVVAICNKTLSSQGAYRALLHTDVLAKAIRT